MIGKDAVKYLDEHKYDFVPSGKMFKAIDETVKYVLKLEQQIKKK